MKWLLFIGLLGSSLCAQVVPELRQKIPLSQPVEHFAVDQFGNLYLVDQGQVQKRSPQGEVQQTYSNPLLGDISKVDALNPLRPLLFYEPVNSLVLLDNRLNPSREINLLDYGLADPQLVTYGDQDHLWIYDQSQDLLLRYGINSGRESYRTGQITQLIEEENQPVDIFSSYDQVVLHTAKRGALLFDAQGSYRRRIPLPDSSRVAFHNYRLVSLTRDGGLRLYDLKKGLRLAGLLPGAPAQQVALEGNQLYILRPQELAVYELQVEP
jgi:hypothetical protein